MDIARLGVEIESNGVLTAEERLKRFQAAGVGAETVVGSLTRAATRAGAALGAAFSIRVLQNYADGWSDMQSRVGSAIKNMAAAPTLMQRITDIANASYSPLQQTNEIFGRNVTVLGALGRSAVEAADFTEALNHALVTTATKGQDADVALNSLSRAISNNRLRTMEFETIMSRSPRVLEAIAEEMGTNVIGLRALAEQGKVTGKVIVDSMINSLEKLRNEAGEMPATMRDAGMIWNNVLNEVVGRVDQAWQATGRLASKSIELAIAFRGTADNLIRIGNIVGSIVGPAFEMLSANMGTITSVATVAVAAVAGFYAPAMISGLWATSAALVTGVAGGIKAITLAMMANPLGLLIGGLAAAVTAAFLFRDKIKQAIGVDVVGVVIDVGDRTIGAFVGAYEAVKEQWSNLPTFFSAIGKMAWNNFLGSFEGAAFTIDTPWGSWQSGGLDLSGAKAQLSPDEMRSFGAAEATFNHAYMRGGYIKGASESLGELWENALGAGDAITALGNSLGGDAASSGLSKEAQKQADAYKSLVRGAHEFIASQQLEAQALGMTAEAAARMRHEQDLLNRAANDNIKLTPAMRNELMGLAAQMAAVEEATRRVTEVYNFGKGLMTGMFSDVSNYLREQSSEWKNLGDVARSVWEGIGLAGANALQKIADKFLENAALGIWDMIFGAVMGSFGGGMGGTMGMFGHSASTPLGFGGTNGIYLGAFATGGTGVIPGSGPTDSVLAMARVTPGEPYAFGPAAMRGIANQNQSNDNVRYGDINVSIERIEANSEAEGAAAARGFQREMKRWQDSGEGKRFVRDTMQKMGRAN